jgi:hypothetical protein
VLCFAMTRSALRVQWLACPIYSGFSTCLPRPRGRGDGHRGQKGGRCFLHALLHIFPSNSVHSFHFPFCRPTQQYFFSPNLAITPPDPESQQSRKKANPASKQAHRCCGVWDILPWPYLCPTYLHRPLGRPTPFSRCLS